jgi:hypothetical protein
LFVAATFATTTNPPSISLRPCCGEAAADAVEQAP